MGGEERTRRSAPTTSPSFTLPLFDITNVTLERAMVGSSMRNKALTENLANAETPGYQRKDVDFHTSLQSALVGGSNAVQQTSFAAMQTGEGAVRADGGTVDIDRENAELAQNGLEYQALSTVVKGRMEILRAAMGR
jgi:flagellar basal-body rod protein FlgB